MSIITKNINISGGDLPTGYKAKVALTLDYTDASIEDLIPRAVRSDVITLQAKYRKMTVKELDDMEVNGITVKSKDVSSGTVVNLGSALKALGYDDKTIQLILTNKDAAMEIFEGMNKE